ncbi:MAG: hypothetical protein GY855_05010 [candidate division Zixibacteria bacterium]|nr:hypothetical protein [candidate division Zixibacteria bacterium]
MNKNVVIPLGIKFIIGFHLLSIFLWIFGQGGAVIAYDTVAEWGFQEPRALSDPALVEVNRGIGLTDIVLQIPLFIISIIGLWKFKFYGAVASWLVFGMTLYWPLVAWANKYFLVQNGIQHQPFDIGTNIILIFIVLFAAWASWYLFKNRNIFE